MRKFVISVMALLGAATSLKAAVRVFPNLSFQRPIFLTSAMDGTNRIFVVEQDGLIYVFPNQDDTTQKKVYLDLSDLVISPAHGGGNEEGLLGLAFDPNYKKNKTFYVYYSAGNPRRSVVARLKASSEDPDKADRSSLQVILEISQPYSNHNGGMMAFGKDGLLYIGLGDGGSGGDPQNNAQRKNSLLGKILRIDVRDSKTYSIPKDNPFVNEAGARGEIWAYGLRNPWRFSFDRKTGDLWVGDVGQNAWEEVNLVRKGDNLGWRVYEGDAVYQGPVPSGVEFTKPVKAYPHGADGGFSITGGYVYRGKALPGLYGWVIYGDYGSNRIWALRKRENGTVENKQIDSVPTISSFGEDESGELYVVSHRSGQLFKIVDDKLTDLSIEIPTKLTETKIFRNIEKLDANWHLLPYQIQVPLWSDGAEKLRWIFIPEGKQFEFAPDRPWAVPVGSMLVKHFEFMQFERSPKRIETRVLFRGENEWKTFTYKWRSDNSDADLLTEEVQEDIEIQTASGPILQHWTYPASWDCQACHNSSEGPVLGFRTEQLGLSKIEDLVDLGYFSNPPSQRGFRFYPQLQDSNSTIHDRARAYLAVNCSTCHNPMGIAPGGMDMRFSTPKDQMNMIDVWPFFDDLGIRDPRRIKSGKKEDSVAWERMRRRGYAQMPPAFSHKTDEQGVELLGQWIDQGTPEN